MYKTVLLLIVVCQAKLVSCEGEDDHDHDQDTVSGYEWGRLYSTPNDFYTWSEQKLLFNTTTTIHQKIAVFPIVAGDVTAAGEEFESMDMVDEARHALSGECQEVELGDIIVPQFDTCFELEFSAFSWQYMFFINTTNSAYIAIFAEHDPAEYFSPVTANVAEFLQSVDGSDANVLHTFPEQDASTSTNNKPWGSVAAATLTLWAVTMAGVVLLVPCVRGLAQRHEHRFQAALSAITAGALIAAAMFLILYESSALIAARYTEDIAVTWRWGTMVLGGFLCATVIDFIASMIVGRSLYAEEMSPDVTLFGGFTGGDPTCAQVHGNASTNDPSKHVAMTTLAETEAVSASTPHVPPKQVEVSLMDVPSSKKAPLTRAQRRVIGGILVGDFMHNFVDGVFIASAFKSCGTSFGWSLTAATIAHELTQEIADFAVLTHQGGLTALKALLFNFLSGGGAVLGALVIMLGDVEDHHLGMILAFGGGVYIHVGAVECMPRFYEHSKTIGIQALGICFFVLGSVAMGLALLNHEHCGHSDADGADAGASDGHNH